MAKTSKELETKIECARENLLAHIKGKGLRWTKQRDGVLVAFIKADKHISAQELYELVRKKVPEIGYATVYRCMNLFVEAGIANARRFDEECARFEPGVEVDHHDHLICTECGAILEFEDERIEKLQDQIAEARGFRVTNHRLEIYGICPDCC